MTRVRRITWKILTDRCEIKKPITNSTSKQRFRRSVVKPHADEEFLFED